MKRTRGLLSLIWNAWGIDQDPSIHKSYSTKCPDCKLNIIGGSRMDVAATYLAHYENDCPGDPAYDFEPNLKA